ncbi:MAG: dipeptidase [Planctomycetota bacterium]
MRFLVDGHQDIAMALLPEVGRDSGPPAPPRAALSLPDSRRARLAVILATIFAPTGSWPGKSAKAAARQQRRIYDEILFRFEKDIFRVESRGDLALCRPGGPIGLVHLMEGADPLERPEALEAWTEEGVRFLGLAWNTPNRYAGGTHDEGGITDEGRALLDVMHEFGVVPDASHLNPRALDDLLALWDGLVVASHSNAYGVRSNERNLRDEHVREIARRGGVIGLMFYAPVLTDGLATLDDVAAHADHLAAIGGVACVGLGSDLDGGFTTDLAPDGIGSVADLPRLGDVLEHRGWSTGDVDAVLGGNWMRLPGEPLPEWAGSPPSATTPEGGASPPPSPSPSSAWRAAGPPLASSRTGSTSRRWPPRPTAPRCGSVARSNPARAPPRPTSPGRSPRRARPRARDAPRSGSSRSRGARPRDFARSSRSPSWTRRARPASSSAASTGCG